MFESGLEVLLVIARRMRENKSECIGVVARTIRRPVLASGDKEREGRARIEYIRLALRGGSVAVRES